VKDASTALRSRALAVLAAEEAVMEVEDLF
jgi:hypothetical protein